MADYKKMYMELFNKVVTVIIEQLQEVQRQTERIYIESSEPKMILLAREDDVISSEHKE
ncbi:hypothetical protein [Dehalobacter sp. 4CP]|uniref:hypothetical protein n=1 Tax=Dehalobacter sp. CP TaxID=2594474 RepID=UPI0039ED57AE|nr:hypothetical protein [Dehalobacter sp.]